MQQGSFGSGSAVQYEPNELWAAESSAGSDELTGIIYLFLFVYTVDAYICTEARIVMIRN